jgi:hypothetical protein
LLIPVGDYLSNVICLRQIFQEFMSIREKYKISAIQNEIKVFQTLISANKFDEAVLYFRDNLEKPTLFGLETSLIRAELLRKIEVEKLSNKADKCFVLYSLALTLNLTGGYPNQAIPLYQKHDSLAEEISDAKSLSQSLGHHAKALRQVGRFFESEQLARKGLKIIREQKDFLREAVNLYWLGMSLAHRGQAEFSEIALQRSLRIFKAQFATQAEGVVNAFLAQRGLWLGLYDEAFSAANRALEIGRELENNENHADLHSAVKILTAAARMKGEALVWQNFNEEGENLLLYALKKAREIEFVEEELPALRALTMLEKLRGNFAKARDYLQQSWHLANRGDFKLYNADSYNILAQIEVLENNITSAIEASKTAYKLAWCDGEEFSYKSGLIESEKLLIKLDAEIPNLKPSEKSNFIMLSVPEINPTDKFFE